MSVGTRLTEARELAGLTVEDVSRSTRIRGTLIRAIEADDFAPCGGAVYARGHIRSIASAVGADAASLIADYDAEHGSPIPSDPTPMFDPEVAERTGQRRPNWSAAMASVLALVSVVAGFQLATSGGKASREGTTAGNALDVTAGKPTTAPPAAAPAPRPTDAVALINPKIVTVRITVTGTKSWVSVTNASGKVLFRGILRKGMVQDFTDAKKLFLTIGNSGAVSLVVNGRDLGAPGANGDVTNVEFGPGDPDGASG